MSTEASQWLSEISRVIENSESIQPIHRLLTFLVQACRSANTVVNFGSLDFAQSISANMISQEPSEVLYLRFDTSNRYFKKISVTAPHQLSSFKEYLEIFCEHFHPKCLGNFPKELLINFSKYLPKELIPTRLSLEWRLDGKGNVDLSTTLPAVPLENLFPTLQKIQNICNSFKKNEKSLVILANLEFDIHEHHLYQTPAIFFRFPFGLSALGNSHQINNILEHQLLAGISKTSLELIQHCRQLLPKPYDFIYIGHMLSRESNHYKIVAQNFEIEKIQTYLNILQWKKSSKKLGRLLENLSKLRYLTAIAIDIKDNRISKVGLELRLSQNTENFCDLFQLLVEEKLCLPENMTTSLSSEFVIWGGNAQFYLSYISHLKITIEEDIFAKIYFACVSSAELVE